MPVVGYFLTWGKSPGHKHLQIEKKREFHFTMLTCQSAQYNTILYIWNPLHFPSKPDHPYTVWCLVHNVIKKWNYGYDHSWLEFTKYIFVTLHTKQTEVPLYRAHWAQGKCQALLDLLNANMLKKSWRRKSNRGKSQEMEKALSKLMHSLCSHGDNVPHWAAVRGTSSELQKYERNTNGENLIWMQCQKRLGLGSVSDELSHTSRYTC